ncbi:MAG: 4Fe-4S dicluster domain-containing protein [Candidatus Bathyarchaeota archaeon]
MAVVIMEPLKGGALADPPLEALEIMESSIKKRSPVDWAFQFLWNKPEVSVVLSGMNYKRMVLENCASADNSGIRSLSLDDKKMFEKLAEVYRKSSIIQCTACGYCMPCPQGINIPQNFACFNNVSLETSRIRRFLARRAYRRLKGSKNKVDFISPNGNSSICNKCGCCLEKCPQGIVIPEELEKINEVLGKRGALF